MGIWIYRIWWLERSELCAELRNAVGRALDSQFFHPMSQGVRMCRILKHNRHLSASVLSLDVSMEFVSRRMGSREVVQV